MPLHQLHIDRVCAPHALTWRLASRLPFFTRWGARTCELLAASFEFTCGVGVASKQWYDRHCAWTACIAALKMIFLTDYEVVLSWPMLYIQVNSVDRWSRYRVEGYGSCRLPDQPGRYMAVPCLPPGLELGRSWCVLSTGVHSIRVPTWRPLGSQAQQMQRSDFCFVILKVQSDLTN